MDSRWRNLLILVIVIVAAIVILNLLQTPLSEDEARKARIDSYFLLLEENDVDYVDLKLSLEFFGEKMSEEKLDVLYSSSSDDYFKQLISFERKQNELVDRMDAFFARPFLEVCFDEKNAWSIYEESFDLVMEMDAFLEKRNDLLINIGMLAFEEQELEESAYEYFATCDSIEGLAVFD
jgi:hypothetical protein